MARWSAGHYRHRHRWAFPLARTCCPDHRWQWRSTSARQFPDRTATSRCHAVAPHPHWTRRCRHTLAIRGTAQSAPPPAATRGAASTSRTARGRPGEAAGPPRHHRIREAEHRFATPRGAENGPSWQDRSVMSVHPVDPPERVVASLLAWYRMHARDLPWRRPGTTPWAVLVSEIMLQQTPVSRVEPTWREWLARWPTPSALAAATPGDAVRAWGTLGYPRRALRLHEAAVAIVRDHGGELPADIDALRELPGVGSYTAAAIASFAFRQRHAVLDTNVRRVLGRVFGAVEHPRPGGPSAAERHLAEALLPARDADAAQWAVASMELGALICTARSPRCEQCPVLAACAWQRAGAPAYSGPTRRGQSYEGTDRQAPGRILGRLRSAAVPLPADELGSVVPDPAQWRRAIDGLIADRLIEATAAGYRLPGPGLG